MRALVVRALVVRALVPALVLALVALHASAPRAWSQAPTPPPALPDAGERMVGAARLWAKVKFFHPYLAYKDLDWDAALVRAIPAIERAATLDQYRDALAAMLAALGDPATRMDRVPSAPAPGVASASITWPAKDIMMVDLAGFTVGGWDSVGFRTRGAEVEKAAEKARVLILDLRVPHQPALVPSAIAYFADVFPAIDAWPTQRSLEHRGFRTQDAGSSFYYSTFLTRGSLPPKPAPATGPGHVVFIADARTMLPAEAVALQRGGRGTIVATGPLDAAATADTIEVALPGGLGAVVRIGESLWGAPVADVTVPANKDPRARAIEIARRPPARRAPRALPALPTLAVRDDKDYLEQPYPSRELRILAGIRVWAVIEHFFPYRYMIEDWDRTLRDALPRLSAAADRDAYIVALREMAARTEDGHVGISPGGPRDPKAKPRALPGVQVRLVEGKLAVVMLLDEAAKKAGLAIGDIVESIDGKPAAAALADKRPQVSGSTVESRDQRNAMGILFGDDGTTVRLGIRDARGIVREVTLARTAANAKASWEPPAIGRPWKRLPGNIGYVDLRRLRVPEIDLALEELEATRAIVFDMRGYPNSTAWGLAPRLNVKQGKHAAQFFMPLVTGDAEPSEGRRVRFLQAIDPAPAGATLYRGKVVVLIDDRAISQAEHTCLFLAEAAPVTFVGSPTHGANGDITQARLPGGLRLTFTGQEVRWVDGRQLQRKGVEPHVVVRPTIAGLRAGRDEVLERALAFIDKGR